MPNHKPPNQDFLKYWRVVRFYVKLKYELNQEELEMLLFLYSERYFKRVDFEEYKKGMDWNEQHFKNLHKRGWIITFRNRRPSLKEGAIYQLSHKARGVIKSIYQKLLGNEDFAVDFKNGPFTKDMTYMQRRYRDRMIKINEEYKELRRKREES